MVNKKLICVLSMLIVPVMLLCSCAANKEDDIAEGGGEASFPRTPDRIVVGYDGEEKTFLPDSTEFGEIVSGIAERDSKSGDYGALLLVASDEDGRHLSYELRESVTFVEYIYDETAAQEFEMTQQNGGKAVEDIDVSRIFFPLDGQYHNEIFIGGDAEYASHTTIGSLTDNTKLTEYVRALFADGGLTE